MNGKTAVGAVVAVAALAVLLRGAHAPSFLSLFSLHLPTPSVRPAGRAGGGQTPEIIGRKRQRREHKKEGKEEMRPPAVPTVVRENTNKANRPTYLIYAEALS